MKVRSLFLAAVLTGTCLAVSPAHALTAAFTPVSGAAFQTVSGTAVHQDGAIVNTSPTDAAVVGASLGGATGSSNYGFTIFGHGEGGTITCTIIPVAPFDGVLPTFSGTVNTFGSFKLFINTTLPAEFINYSVECTLPRQAFLPSKIFGVYPTN